METSLEEVDNRSNWRYETSVSMTFFRFSSQKAPSIGANALNFSERGLCFQSPYPLKTGQCICIRTEPVRSEYDPSFGSDMPMLKSFSLAEVRWCRKADTAQRGGYHIGVKYL
jgi:hypothetical protein